MHFPRRVASFVLSKLFPLFPFPFLILKHFSLSHRVELYAFTPLPLLFLSSSVSFDLSAAHHQPCKQAKEEEEEVSTERRRRHIPPSPSLFLFCSKLDFPSSKGKVFKKVRGKEACFCCVRRPGFYSDGPVFFWTYGGGFTDKVLKPATIHGYVVWVWGESESPSSKGTIISTTCPGMPARSIVALLISRVE